jgi:hypothetical protein
MPGVARRMSSTAATRSAIETERQCRPSAATASSGVVQAKTFSTVSRLHHTGPVCQSELD